MAKPADTWMPLYIGDYLADTMHLDGTEHGVYLLLIMAYWRNGGPLANDEVGLRKVARVSAKVWRRTRPVVERFFVIDVERQLWRHKRIDAELENAEKLANAHSLGGKITAAKRWKGDSSATSSATSSAGSSPPSSGVASRAPVLPSPSPSPSLLTVSKETERESRAREAPGPEALSQSVDKFEVSEELIAQAAEARAKVRLDPVNLHAEAAKFSLSHATQSPQGWLRWALIARADLLPAPNGHDPPFVYVPDLPKGPPPPFDPDEPTP